MEGVAKVIRGMVLVRPLGIVGDAIGTLIPSALHSALFFTAPHLPSAWRSDSQIPYRALLLPLGPLPFQ